MDENEQLGQELQQTLEAHERELKRALESLGRVREELEQAAVESTDDDALDRLTAVGRRLERHENHLQAVVETLDGHKRVVRRIDSADRTALKEAMEKARHQARQETHPVDPTQDDRSHPGDTDDR